MSKGKEEEEEDPRPNDPNPLPTFLQRKPFPIPNAVNSVSNNRLAPLPPLAGAATSSSSSSSSFAMLGHNPNPSPSSGGFVNPFIKSGGGGHRRAHSEVSFRLPEDMMDLSTSDPFTGGSSTASLDEIGSEDDLFSTYIDVDKLAGATGDHGGGGGVVEVKLEGSNNGARPRHRHSCSVDGSSTSTATVFGEIMDAKKAMPPDKLAELWTIDPKRAKRSLLFSFLSLSIVRRELK